MSEPSKVSFTHSALTAANEELTHADDLFGLYAQMIYGGTSGLVSNWNATNQVQVDGSSAPLDYEVDLTLPSLNPPATVTAAQRQKQLRQLFLAAAKLAPRTSVGEIETGQNKSTNTYSNFATATVNKHRAQSKFLISADFSFFQDDAGGNYGEFRIMTDGVAFLPAVRRVFINDTGHESVSLKWLTSNLSIGSHTLTLQWRSSGSNTIQNDFNDFGTFTIQEVS